MRPISHTSHRPGKTIDARGRRDLLILVLATGALLVAATAFDVFERLRSWTAGRMHLDELMFAACAGAVGLSIVLGRRLADSRQQAQRRELTLAGLEKRHALLSAVIENAPAMIQVKDAAGRCVLSNRAFNAAFDGASDAVEVGSMPPAGTTQASPLADVERDVLSSGVLRETEGTRTQATADRTFHSVCFKLPGREANDAICTIATDVTARRRDEDARQQAQTRDATGRLAAGIAHDFNNLLGVITGYTELLTRDVGDEPKKLKRVESIRNAAERAAGFTRQLMSLSRGLELNPRVVDIDDALRVLQPTLRGAIGEHIEIVLSLNSGARVLIDPAQFDQVVMSLALHSRDALDAGGTLTIHTAERDGLLLTISDNGPGISAPMLPHVFEPFFAIKPKGKGPGLALATAYGVVSQSGGKLWVESEPGRGTAFHLLLPIVAAQVEHRTSAPAPAPALAARPAEGTLLVVEDDDALRVVVRETLSSAGYKVIDCPGPSQALAAAATSACIDLLITDCVMPGMSGYQLAEALRDTRPGTPVLYMSGHSQRVLNLPQDVPLDFLAKPFTGSTLLERVARRLAGRMAEPAAAVHASK